jgi:uncharacterized protein (TIGR02217 family)
MEVFPSELTFTLTRSLVSQRIRSSAQRRWQQRRQTLHRPFYTFDLTSESLNQSQIETLNEFYLVHEFQDQDDDDAFLLRDPEDNERTNENMGVGDGSETQFTIKANYTYGNKSVEVVQGHIVSGSETIYKDNTEVSTSDYTINNTTGLVTFDTAPADSVQIEADYEFRRKCIFQEENLGIERSNPVTADVSYLIVEVP